ncbi:DUF4406 domain-containing protein [Pedobacter sp.]|uniref:DUF4406 domain-containing protein n=1 Tax=Pedobacter sp. TaxID=1411316 RepID=UPI00396C6FE8
MAKIYIAGKVKGLPKDQVAKKFEIAAKTIKDAGHDPVNPFEHIDALNNILIENGELPLSDDDTQQRNEILKICLDLLTECDHIYLLHDWQDSQGATFEKQVADAFNIPVYGTD